MKRLMIVLALSLASLSATQGGAAPKAGAPVAAWTIQDIMDQTVDPAADGLWGSVGEIETASGVKHRAPATPAQWRRVRDLARRLGQGAEALHFPHAVGGDGSKLADASTPGARTAKDIAGEIAADPARFRAHADRLRQAAALAAKAADSRNPAGLLEAGAAIDAACESCHAAYWYPRSHIAMPGEDVFKGAVQGK